MKSLMQYKKHIEIRVMMVNKKYKGFVLALLIVLSGVYVDTNAKAESFVVSSMDSFITSREKTEQKKIGYAYKGEVLEIASILRAGSGIPEWRGVNFIDNENKGRLGKIIFKSSNDEDVKTVESGKLNFVQVKLPEDMENIHKIYQVIVSDVRDINIPKPELRVSLKYSDADGLFDALVLVYDPRKIKEIKVGSSNNYRYELGEVRNGVNGMVEQEYKILNSNIDKRGLKDNIKIKYMALNNNGSYDEYEDEKHITTIKIYESELALAVDLKSYDSNGVADTLVFKNIGKEKTITITKISKIDGVNVSSINRGDVSIASGKAQEFKLDDSSCMSDKNINFEIEYMVGNEKLTGKIVINCYRVPTIPMLDEGKQWWVGTGIISTLAVETIVTVGAIVYSFCTYNVAV